MVNSIQDKELVKYLASLGSKMAFFIPTELKMHIKELMLTVNYF